MSSKTEGKDSNRGLKNDPKDERGSAEVEEQRQQRALELDEESGRAGSGEEMRAIDRLLKRCRKEGLRQREESGKGQRIGQRPQEEVEGEQGSQCDVRGSVVLGRPCGLDIDMMNEDNIALGTPDVSDFLEGEQNSQRPGGCLTESRDALADAASKAYTSPPTGGLRRTVLEASSRQAFEKCRHNLATACQKKGLKFEEIGEALLEALKVQEKSYMRCSKTKGDLFPLPLPSSLKAVVPPKVFTDALVQALNSLYGTKTIVRMREDRTRLNMVERLQKVVEESELRGCEVPEIDFGEFFKARSVDYSGEIVQVARRFDWRMVEAAFPEAVGS